MRIQVDDTVRDMTPEEETEYLKAIAPTDEEALTRYANELTGANDPDLISAAETLIKQRMEES